MKITPRKKTDEGVYLLMPLVENVPHPADPTWKKTLCPKCRRGCWDRKLPVGFTANMIAGKLCTECGVRMAGRPQDEKSTI